jgi:hypothetical protein
LTYIEAQALTGKIEAAENLSKDVFKQENGIRRGLCELWKRVQAQSAALSESEGPGGSEEGTRVNQILSTFECTQ